MKLLFRQEEVSLFPSVLLLIGWFILTVNKEANKSGTTYRHAVAIVHFQV
jgi:hypothetical protein